MVKNKNLLTYVIIAIIAFLILLLIGTNVDREAKLDGSSYKIYLESVNNMTKGYSDEDKNSLLNALNYTYYSYLLAHQKDGSPYAIMVGTSPDIEKYLSQIDGYTAKDIREAAATQVKEKPVNELDLSSYLAFAKSYFGYAYSHHPSSDYDSNFLILQQNYFELRNLSYLQKVDTGYPIEDVYNTVFKSKLDRLKAINMDHPEIMFATLKEFEQNKQVSEVKELIRLNMNPPNRKQQLAILDNTAAILRNKLTVKDYKASPRCQMKDLKISDMVTMSQTINDISFNSFDFVVTNANNSFNNLDMIIIYHYEGNYYLNSQSVHLPNLIERDEPVRIKVPVLDNIGNVALLDRSKIDSYKVVFKSCSSDFESDWFNDADSLKKSIQAMEKKAASYR